MPKKRSQSGSAILETAMFVPVLVLLMMGTVELARFTYTYYTLHKIMYALARYISTQQGVNFCDSNDAVVAAALSFALNGTTDNSGDAIVPNLTSDMISVRIEQADPASGAINECSCGVPGCDTTNGGTPPDYVVVSIPNGYMITPHIPLVPTTPFAFKPQVRVPYGGT